MRPRFALIVALAAFACATADRPRLSDLYGTPLAEPVPRPDFTLTATDGAPFNFRERTQGQLTLLFFGYTHCPDVCPVHAANIAAVYRDLSWEDRQRTNFVFVSLDPDRDSLPAIRAWLDAFDSSFIGLRGDLDYVNEIMAGLMLPPALIGEPDESGRYEVGHSAVVYAFEPNDTARVVYPFGTRQDHWARDIPRLLGDAGR